MDWVHAKKALLIEQIFLYLDTWYSLFAKIVCNQTSQNIWLKWITFQVYVDDLKYKYVNLELLFPSGKIYWCS